MQAKRILIASNSKLFSRALTRVVSSDKYEVTTVSDGKEVLANVENIDLYLLQDSLVNVVYVSVGHRVSLNTAIELTLSCCKQYRIPETTRYAHKAASGKPLLLDQNQISLF